LEEFSPLKSRKYTCGFCGNVVASNVGYYREGTSDFLAICPHCDRPTYFGDGLGQQPRAMPGNEVTHLPEELEALYLEARRCIAAGAHTASVLVCRKLLMHIAVEKGAKAGGTFLAYVDFLAEKGYVPLMARPGLTTSARREMRPTTRLC
jgi:hypothetical protein